MITILSSIKNIFIKLYKYRDLKFSVILTLILSYLSCYSISVQFSYSSQSEFNDSIMCSILFIIIFFFAYRIKHLRYSNVVHYTAVFSSILFAFIILIGNNLYYLDSIQYIFDTPLHLFNNLFNIIGLFYLLYILILHIFVFILNYKVKETSIYTIWFTSNIRSFILVSILIFICWLPCWLAYFPGVFVYDVRYQYLIYSNSRSIDDTHSLLHTLFFILAFKIGGTNQNGVIAYSLLQMTIMSIVFSFTLFYLAKLKSPFWTRLVALIWFSLSPYIALFSFSTTKDVFFGAFTVLITLMLIDLSLNADLFFKNITKQMTLCSLLIVLCLFRHNGFQAIIIISILILLLYRKYWKNILSIFFSAIIITWIIINPLFTSIGIKSPIFLSTTDTLKLIPCQQIGKIAVNKWDDLTIEDQEDINSFFPINIKDNYNRFNSDPLTSTIDFSVKSKIDFTKLWIRLLKRYPIDFIESFIILNMPYWYPEATAQYSSWLYIEDGVKSGFENITRESFFPQLYEYYHNFANYESYIQHIPIFSILFSLGTPIWLIFIVFLICIINKNIKFSSALLPSAAIWFTFLFGPVSIGRYMYPLFASYPLYLVIVVLVKIHTSPNILDKIVL